MTEPPQDPINVFLDCGANDGCSVHRFRQIMPDWRSYVIHSFEPNPVMRSHFPHFENVVFHQEAVWVRDGEAPFYLSRAYREDGSTLLSTKTTGFLDMQHPITVRCLNLGAWIKKTFREHDRILLKLDVEGAEYAILESMMRDGSIAYIKGLYAEFHWHKIGMAKTDHDIMIHHLAKSGLDRKSVV